MTKSPRIPLRQEQQQLTRQRLLEASRESFVERGFVETTVDRIVELAGTSRATFYLHFKGKTDALLATWTEWDQPEVDAMFRAFDVAGDFSRAATRRWMTEVVAYWEDHGGIAMTANQALALEPELTGTWFQGIIGVARDMPNLAARLDPNAGLAEAVLVTKIIQFERTLYYWTNTTVPFTRENLIEALAREWSVDD